MKLNIGCGDLPAPAPWVNIDTNPDLKPDVVASLTALPYPDGSVEAVYCGHVLEHLDLDVGVPLALAEVRRVLKPTGRACFVGPDFDRALAVDPDPVLLDCIRFGGNRWEGDAHLWTSTGITSLTAIRSVFPNAIDIPVEHLDPYWPIAFRVGWQFAIVTEE